MLLVDTSAWIEFLRDTGSEVSSLVEDALSGEAVVCDAVRMEVFAGARNEAHLSNLQGLLELAEAIPTLPSDYEDAAILYRRCRVEGETVRKILDCLIAAVAIRVNAPILHRDADFDVLARHTELRTYENGL